MAEDEQARNPPWLSEVLEKLDRNYEVSLRIEQHIMRKTAAHSKFQEAISLIQSLPADFQIHTSLAADLLYPKIYSARYHAKKAIQQMVKAGLLVEEGVQLRKAHNNEKQDER